MDEELLQARIDEHRELILTSSAFRVIPLLRSYIRHRHIKSMAYIPTAATGYPYAAFSNVMIWVWRSMGVRVRVVDVARMRQGRAQRVLESCDAIYIGGGNTFYLMRCLHTSGVISTIRAMVAQGIPYIGESAGSVVCAPVIDYIQYMDDNRAYITDTVIPGLCLTQYRVVPHIGMISVGTQAQSILDHEDHAHDLIPLRNNQLLQIHGTQSRICTLS